MAKELNLKKSFMLKTLITIMMVSLTTISILAVVMIGYYNLNKMSQDLVKDKCDNIVQMMSLYVDAQKLNESIKKYDPDDPYLAQLQQQLYHVKEKTNAEYIYIVADKGDNVEYIVDASAPTTAEDYLSLGSSEPKSYYDGIENAFTTGDRTISDLYEFEETDGTVYNLISAYFPIKTSDGQVIAILGGDISVNQNMEDLQKILNEFIIVFFVLVALSTIIAIIFCMYLFRPLGKIVTHIRELSKGDFTIQYHYNKNNETGKINHSLSHLVVSLKKMFGVITHSSEKLGETAQVLDDSTKQIAVSIQGVNRVVGCIASSANQQAEYAKTGMENMEVLKENTSLNISNLKELISALKEATSCKEEGLETIEFLKQQSAVSNKTLEKMGEDIQKTNDSVTHIGTASTAIKDIASQTNLLALNASIEAARAGESGKGFAVVAEEIRKLSEESNASADQISQIIETLIKNSENMVATMDEMSESMKEQAEGVVRTEQSFEQISHTIDTTHESLENLSTSSFSMKQAEQELDAIFQQIAESVDSHAEETEEASASMQEQTAIMEEIAQKAKQLAEETEQLDASLETFTF